MRTFPNELRVLPNGSWEVDGVPVVHASTLRYLKAHLVPQDDGSVAIVDGANRLSVGLEGPPLEVTSLSVDPRGSVKALLDDGSEEMVGDGSIGMDEWTGRFEFGARGGRVRALLSRKAHETLLSHVEEAEG